MKKLFLSHCRLKKCLPLFKAYLIVASLDEQQSFAASIKQVYFFELKKNSLAANSILMGDKDLTSLLVRRDIWRNVCPTFLIHDLVFFKQKVGSLQSRLSPFYFVFRKKKEDLRQQMTQEIKELAEAKQIEELKK